MSNVYLRCKNKACLLHNNPMVWTEGPSSTLCPVCQSQMEIDESLGVVKRDQLSAIYDGAADDDSDWLFRMAEDEKYWISDAETVYPSILAYKYRYLRQLCREGKAYAILFCLKDNFEALLKLEVLLAFAWIRKEWPDEADKFAMNTISPLMTRKLSLGSWISLSSVILNNLENIGKVLPESIPLDKIRMQYERKKIVNWRNEKIGHGAMEMSEDEEFRKDIRKKVEILKKLYSSVDMQLRGQLLYLKGGHDIQKGDTDELILTGADMARGLPRSGLVHFRTADGRVSFCVDPFIIIRKHEKNGYGIYFFDNQMTRSLTHFLAYSDGSRANEKNLEYFVELDKYFESHDINPETKVDESADINPETMADESAGIKLETRVDESADINPETMADESADINPETMADESAGIKLETRVDDRYLSEKEIRAMDLPQMSHDFVRPEHLVRWLERCLELHDKGIFLLQMERGTGKSVFTEKLSRLTEKHLRIGEDLDDLDVRTYHFSRSQVAGTGDFRSAIEWMWSTDSTKSIWVRIPHICDYERDGKTSGEALCAFLEEALIYSRRNRKKDRLLMIFDGLDEISEESLWRFIPEEGMLGNGIYILLTSRNPWTEKLTNDTIDRLNKLPVTEKLTIGREEDENVKFLGEYISHTRLKNLTDEEKRKLVTLADHRALQLGLLCKLAENGMGIGELPKSDEVVKVYLDTLENRYGEKESVRLRELLATLCTLGMYEGLTLETLGELTGENGITLKLIGMVRDLAPMLKTERGEEGNVYTIANSDLAEELEKQIPETEDTVRWIVDLAMSVMRDGDLEKEKGLEAAAAHVVELAIRKLDNGVDALGNDAKSVLWNNADNWQRPMDSRRSRDRALDYWSQVCMYLEKKKGDGDWYTQMARDVMAEMLGSLGRFEEKLFIERKEYENRKKLFGENHRETLFIQQNMVQTLRELGRFKEAMVICQEVYEKRKKQFGEDHLETLDAKHDMAMMLAEFGRYDEALEKYQEVYEKKKKLLGEDNPDTLTTLGNMAGILGKLGRYEEELLLEKAVLEKTESLEEDHIPTLITQAKIAMALGKLGRYEEALQEMERAYGKHKILLGEDHPNTLKMHSDMAWILRELGRNEEALAIYREVYRKQREFFGEDHPDILTTQENIAGTLRNLGRYEEAFAMFQEVHGKQKELLGEDHPDTLRIQENIAGTLKDLGCYKEALAMFREVYEKRKILFGEDHPYTLTTQRGMASTFINLERYEEALCMYRDVYRKRKKTLGEDHPDMIEMKRTIEWILEELGCNEEELPL